MTPEATIDEVRVADPPERWEEVGFQVDGGVAHVGTVRFRLAGPDAGRGVVGWSVRGLATAELDGLPTTPSDTELPPHAAPHPNGSGSLDHLVVMTPAFERTVEALKRAGLDFRRIREGPTPGGAMRQAFFRLAEVILEVIEQPQGPRPRDPRKPAKLWGLAFRVDDLDECAALLGDRLGPARDAVQPGRRIATLRKSAGLSMAVAFITPPLEG